MKMKKISFVIACLMSSIANAAPAGGAFTQGSGSININGTIVDVDIASKIAVIDWNSFNVAQGETVNFNKTGETGIAINVDNQGSQSQIAGNINANNVSLVVLNKNGVNLNGASINANNGFVAAAGELQSVVDNVPFSSINIVLSNVSMSVDSNTTITSNNPGGKGVASVKFNTQGNDVSMPVVANWGSSFPWATNIAISGGGSVSGDTLLNNAIMAVEGGTSVKLSGIIDNSGRIDAKNSGGLTIGDISGKTPDSTLTIDTGSVIFDNSTLDNVNLLFTSYEYDGANPVNVVLNGAVADSNQSSMQFGLLFADTGTGSVTNNADIKASNFTMNSVIFINNGSLVVDNSFIGNRSLNITNNGDFSAQSINQWLQLSNYGSVNASFSLDSGTNIINYTPNAGTVDNRGQISAGSLNNVAFVSNEGTMKVGAIQEVNVVAQVYNKAGGTLEAGQMNVATLSNAAGGTVTLDHAVIGTVENHGLIQAKQAGGLITSVSITNSGEITQSEEAHKSTLTASINNTGRIDFGTKAVDPQPPVVDPQPPVVDPQPPVVDPQPPVVDPQPPVVDPQPPVVDPQPPVVDPQPPVVDAATFRPGVQVVFDDSRRDISAQGTTLQIGIGHDGHSNVELNIE
ncbi:filamentous hemagglutinin N-terminal domain-containing protein [Aeromonas veronii]|uniref:filamentous hemagglutinin N-terminal domain-containing protein n=1 Tax=Aeromonas veronii TaxID=654 RepID=UPI00187E054D|nr:filamentous hemagglutinin N-terminal domain-containing protein [Aeromonas veronii]MBE8841694.1 filamentous hemagglutinin N-terminal domain-containing protein [Aeromonas veronii]